MMMDKEEEKANSVNSFGHRCMHFFRRQVRLNGLLVPIIRHVQVLFLQLPVIFVVL